MDFTQTLNEHGFQLLLRREFGPRNADCLPYPNEVLPKLQNYFAEKFPRGLYRHQAEAIQAALKGEDVILSTGTASGKTLAFAIPAFQLIMNDPQARVMFFYPTKALAGDQLKKMEKYAFDLGLEGIVARFDGDVVGSEKRKAILRHARILLCTPDIVHAALLPNGQKSPALDVFRNLKMVILDEAHVYSGVFGSNMAFLLRRIQQVCCKHGNRLQFICASATSGQPVDHVYRLTGREATLIDSSMDGSPSGGRQFFFADAVDPEGSLFALLYSLKQQGKRFLVFRDTRKGTERMYSDLVDTYPDLLGHVMPYRSGYEVNDRVKIEQALSDGQICGVLSTSALELGVDIRNMEVCVMIGLPNSSMSFWQRAGRVGRQSDSIGHVLILLGDTCIDNYYRPHPERYLDKPLERLQINLDNWPLIATHFACARSEIKDFADDEFDESIFGEEFVQLKRQVENGDIVDERISTFSPHADLSLRGIDDPNYRICIDSESGEKIGSITWAQILNEAYPKALYLHMGDKYRVKTIKRRGDYALIVHPEPSPKKSTNPIGHITVQQTASNNGIYRYTKWGTALELWHSDVKVAFFVDGFRELQDSQVVYQEKYEHPLTRIINTEGVWLKFGAGFPYKPNKDGLNALAHVLANLYAVKTTCNLADIATHVKTNSSDGCSYLYIFDITSGGLGFSSQVYDLLQELLDDALPLLAENGCSSCDIEDDPDKGCPACIRLLKWMEDNDHLSKREALKLVKAINELILVEGAQSFETPRYRQHTVGELTAIAVSSNQATDSIDEEIVPRNYIDAYKANSSVKLRDGKMAIVQDHMIDGRSIVYVIRREDGRVFRAQHGNISFMSGEVERICLNCGALCNPEAQYCEACDAIFQDAVG